MRIWGNKMNRKLLLGSVLVLTLLLLMPSIPAIQHNIVKEDIKDRISNELPKDLDIHDIKELVDSGKLDRIKRPLLYLFVISIAGLGFIFSSILLEFSSDFKDGELYVYFLLLYVFGAWLWMNIDVGWLGGWQHMSDKYGWNWNISEW